MKDRLMKHKKIVFGIVIAVVLILLYIFVPRGILIEPNMTPAEYLSSKPYITIFSNLTIIVPSSTIVVYILGWIILYVGSRFMTRNKRLWGYSMIFWGLSTLLAGTSYQGLGYELKCEGLDYCMFTSWFETSYQFFMAISISLLAIAFSKDFYHKKWLIYYAKIALVVYTLLLLFGSIFEVYILISYELFTVFFMPIFLVLFIINVRNYHNTKQAIDKSFIKLWILFLIVNMAYYFYYLPGFTETIYNNMNFWFSANDVLHVGLILWFVYMDRKLVNQIAL